MAKFAVYTILPAESLLYQRGAELLGYDVYTGAFLPHENTTRAALPEFDPAWVAKPQTYGFHMTTGYSLYYDPAKLTQIEAEIETIIACFGRETRFGLSPAADPIPFWHDTIAVLHFNPNPAMLMLHTMLTARVNPYGTSSNVSLSYAHKDSRELDPVNVARVKHFHTPYILDGWTPHFSLMYPYKGTQPALMKSALHELFPPQPLEIQSICLLTRGDDDTHYRVHREFQLH